MAAPPPPRPRVSPPAIPDEIVEEILLRYPPDEPACLLRSSLVCKDWCCAVSRPDFRRRLHELPREPPMLGFLHDWQEESIPHFVPTTASPFSFAAPDWRFWRAVDCRHGRALFISNTWDADELLVWEPITGAQQRIPLPLPAELEVDFLGDFGVNFGAAVFCSADGCHHRDCLGGPFGLCFVFCVKGEYAEGEAYITSACVYSSENGTWGELTSMLDYEMANFGCYSSVLVGRSLLYFMANGGLVLEYDLASHNLTGFDTPISSWDIGRFNLMLAEDGGVGVCQAICAHLILWSREENDGTHARWVASRGIDLENLLPNGALGVGGGDKRVQVLGFAEGANIIFFNTVSGLFTIELQSEKVKKVCPDLGFCNLIPVTGFYTPVPRRKLQNLPTSKPTEEAGDEEKTIDQSHHLFDKGCNAIKEGDFVNTFESVSQDLKISVPCYGEGALEGAIMLNKHGCALLLKDSSDDVADSAPNEESMKGTTSKDDTMNSTTSDSNAEGAPASDKDLKERTLKQQQEERKHECKEKKDAKKKEQTGQAEDIDP